MVKVYPSLLSADFLNLKSELEALEKAGVDGVHFDVMDGQFVPNISIGLPILEAVNAGTDLTIDVHLMIEDPENFIPEFAAKGADMISVHAEATPHIHRAIQLIHAHGAKAGVVINPGTSVAMIEPILHDVDYVLIMTVNPGFGGQAFISQNIDKVSALHAFKEKYQLDFDIEVDGGINEVTAEQCVDAGATMLVTGSYFFKQDDYGKVVKALKRQDN
ncbi:putative ribulose-5-phosphate 3-epimerase [Staphylococcus piscifermentans]|uniref:Ribulose-phosphate 3-epimerase n=1 Tax=Staphylococcus piscifermentans TaxID=70258 RepID=A0A239U6M5_9STAP|nr:ribulose-phosphate 3-epimerase [Staphylococcus piscifermentans]RTX85796.1 ribulose-phosphate 3-epimerase [Staphylococcus piscifermentans]GEP84157.1 ribulose-phosphate 3-epimerase [Staphylococcus piscifermentans]SNV05606.1 putative ribulose-5-phosphate 3-epimerase [Staphylococcus piscifermentans]